MYKATYRKSPVKFTYNNATIVAPVNDCVPACGFVTVLDEGEYCPATQSNGMQAAVKLYVKVNKRGGAEHGRIYALFYNLVTQQFDGNFTVN